MFSPVARDLLKPQMFNRMDNLMKPTLPVLDDPWIDDYYKFNTFTNKLRDFPSYNRSNSFQLFLNVNQFRPEDLSIKIVDGLIVVQGKHSIKKDFKGYVSREFTRRCKIPDYVDPESLSAVFNKNGLLIIKAKMKPDDSVSDSQVTIPIEIQKTAQEKDKNVNISKDLKDSSELPNVSIKKEKH